MSTTTVSALRQRMIEDMNLRNLAPRTQEAYIRGCKKLAAFLRRSPDKAPEPGLTDRAGSRRAGSCASAAAVHSSETTSTN